MRKQRSRLVVQHVERMSGRILDEHPHVIREYVRGKRGIYALYRRSKLYYVGLASDLRRRLKAHLRDRHAGKWDWFGLYLTETLEHLRELEALTLRITMPQGNKAKTKFASSRDLRRYFKRMIRDALRTGDIGAIVHRYSPGAYEVEFVTGGGDTVAVLTLSDAEVRPLAAGEILHARSLGAFPGQSIP